MSGTEPAPFDLPSRGPTAELLGAVDEVGRSQIVAGATFRTAAAGEVVLAQGDFVDHLYVVADGVLRAEVPDRHGLPLEVARYGPGEYFGEMSFLRGERASATVRALTGSRLVRIPHVVLGDVAERNAGLIRQLAGVVAARLSATNLRFRQLRPGRAVACVGSGSEWARAAMAQVLVAASRHCRRPVVLVDTRQTSRWQGLETLPPLERLVHEPEALATIDAFAASAFPAVGVVAGAAPGIPLEPLLHVLSELQSRYPLVVIWSELGETGGRGLVESADGPLLFVDDGDDERRWVDFKGRQGAQVVRLTNERAAQGGAHPMVSGIPVVKAIAGGPGALQRTRAADGVDDSSPWRDVDWCARHLIRKKVGLALGAGGSKGYAHLGVAEGLRSLGITFDYVAGSSIGAPIAAALAGDVELEDLKRNLDRTFSMAMRPTLPLRSFLSSRPVRRQLEAIAAGRRIEQLGMPLAIVATDLYQRTEVVFRHGPIAPAMVASMAIPGIFPPVHLGGRVLVDGGLLNPIPSATVADMGADVVIGVKLTNPVGPQRSAAPRRRFVLRAPPIVDSISNAFEVMQWKITTEGAARSDVSIEPEFSGLTGLREYTRGSEFVEAGRRAVAESRDALAELLPWTGRPA